MKSEKHPKVDDEVLKRLNIALDFLLETKGLNPRSIALRMKIIIPTFIESLLGKGR